ncbi:hypothetical protein [Parathalassolituus penaei]|uniref:Sel1 repeat family protein n=1 Tax=Parathalassolituus penaei TaxID=2997323 RepID=A0A9X3IQE0_9GAMM|nr:hypothetical protein [Parathalassolituus penaei]MCY0964072.1 hypothetical protein [Parathalassolituus penaei]
MNSFKHLLASVLLIMPLSLLAETSTASTSVDDDQNPDIDYSVSELSYENYVHSSKRIKCLYGYAAEKTGDHKAAMAIFNDCISRWHDVYSMIWLAQMYEAGVSMPRDLKRSTELMGMGAEDAEIGGYAALARYHYGVALYEGKGIQSNPEQAIHWLKRANAEGVPEAGEYLHKLGLAAE